MEAARNGHTVIIAGGGPTGMMLAGELKLAGLDPLVVERRMSAELDGSRAGGLHSRTIEIFDQRGIADRFLAAGQVMQIQGFAGIPLDISDFPTRHNYGLALWQNEIERIMAEWIDDLGVTFLRGREVSGFTQNDSGMDVELSDGETLRCEYLVGCDGGRSVVRKAAGIDFPGLDPSTSYLLAEVDMSETPQVGMRPEGGGIGPVNIGSAGGPYRVVLKERHIDAEGEPTLEQVREALIASYGSDFGVHSPTWISRFTDMSRQAATYRKGRVLLAGDAAHVHPPQGGQGLNTGVQDAFNLGWKLAQVVRDQSPESLLDTYHSERHPVAARVLHNTQAQVALGTFDDRHPALREIVAELLTMDEPRRRIAGMLTALDICYEPRGEHPLVGRRAPDFDLTTPPGATRLYELLRTARPVLLNLDGGGSFDVAPWRSRVEYAEASTEGPWQIPVVGDIQPVGAVLVRPDGYVAWAGSPADPSLAQALDRWFGRGK